jgi:hypothetical protein
MTQTLMVSNLPTAADENWIRDHTAHPERIVSVTLMHPAEPGRHGTTAVVEIDADPTMANRMVEQLHGRIVEGRKIRVYAPLHA